MELVICEKWTQHVSNPTEKWFLDYVARSPRDADVHLTAKWCAEFIPTPAYLIGLQVWG